MKNQKIMVFTALFLTLIFTGIVCAYASSATGPKLGGVLKIITTGSPRIFGYPPKIGGHDGTYVHPVFERLLRIDGKGGYTPFLATKWDINEDGKSITFTLRQGVKFHDGTDFDAKAVKYDLDALRVAKTTLKSIKSIDILDNYHVRLNLSGYSSGLLWALSHTEGNLASPTALEKHGEKWANTHPVGTGPFRFKHFKRGVSLKFEKFDDYWDKGKPYLDGIEYLIIADPMTASASLQAGDAHMWVWAPVKQGSDLKKEGYNVISRMNLMVGLGPDSKHPDSPFADERVRQAIEHAIDRKTIADTVGLGFWEAATQLSSSIIPAYDPDLKGYPYDPEKAKKLLAQAGYAKGFKTTIIVAAHMASRDAMIAIQGYLKEVGIDAEVEIPDKGKYYEYNYKGWKNGLLFCVVGQDSDFAMALSRLWLSSSRWYTSVARPSGFDEAVKKAMAERDAKRQIELSREAANLASKKAMFIPLWGKARIHILRESVNDTYLFKWDRTVWAPAEAWLSK